MNTKRLLPVLFCIAPAIACDSSEPLPDEPTLHCQGEDGELVDCDADELEIIASVEPHCDVVFSTTFEPGLDAGDALNLRYGRIETFENAVARQSIALTDAQKKMLDAGEAIVDVVDLSMGPVLHPNGVVEEPKWFEAAIAEYAAQFPADAGIEGELRRFEARLKLNGYNPENTAQLKTRALYSGIMTGDCNGGEPTVDTCDATCYLKYISTRDWELGLTFEKDEWTCKPALGAATPTSSFVNCSDGEPFDAGSYGAFGYCDKRGVLEAQCDFAPSREGACDNATCKVFGKDTVDIDVDLHASKEASVFNDGSANSEATVSTLARQWNNAENWEINMDLEASTSNCGEGTGHVSLDCGITFVVGVPVPYCRLSAGGRIDLGDYFDCVSKRWTANLDRHFHGSTPISYVEVRHFPGTATNEEGDEVESNDTTQIGPMKVHTTHASYARSDEGDFGANYWAKANARTKASVVSKMTSVANGRAPANVVLNCEEGNPQEIALRCE